VVEHGDDQAVHLPSTWQREGGHKLGAVPVQPGGGARSGFCLGAGHRGCSALSGVAGWLGTGMRELQGN